MCVNIELNCDLIFVFFWILQTIGKVARWIIWCRCSGPVSEARDQLLWAVRLTLSTWLQALLCRTVRAPIQIPKRKTLTWKNCLSKNTATYHHFWLKSANWNILGTVQIFSVLQKKEKDQSPNLWPGPSFQSTFTVVTLFSQLLCRRRVKQTVSSHLIDGETWAAPSHFPYFSQCCPYSLKHRSWHFLGSLSIYYFSIESINLVLGFILFPPYLASLMS